MLNEFSARVGCKRKIILINEMAMFRLKSCTHFGHIIFTITQNIDVIKNRMIGSIAIKNNLKNVFEGNGPVTSISVKKQSNDKNVSDDDPTLSTG